MGMGGLENVQNSKCSFLFSFLFNFKVFDLMREKNKKIFLFIKY